MPKQTKASKKAKKRVDKGLPPVATRNAAFMPMIERKSGSHGNKKHEQRKNACRGKYRGD